jgi:hypothetical protein
VRDSERVKFREKVTRRTTAKATATAGSARPGG